MDNFRPVQSSIGRKVSLVNTKLGENGAGWDSDSYSDDDCDVDNGDHGDGDGNYGDSESDGVFRVSGPDASWFVPSE